MDKYKNNYVWETFKAGKCRITKNRFWETISATVSGSITTADP